MRRCVPWVGTLPAKAPPWRVGDRRHGSRSIYRPRFRPSCVSDANHKSAGASDDVAAVTTGQSGNDTALSQAGAKAALGRGASADQHIRAEPYRRNPDLRQSQRLGRRRYQLRFAQCPARQTQKARAAAVLRTIVPSRRRRHSRRCRPTTRLPLHRRLRSRSKCHRRRSIRCAPQMRVGATLPPPPPPLQEELVNNPPPEVHPLAAANRPGSGLAAPGPQFYAYAVSSYLPDYVANPPPPNLQPPNTFALGQRLEGHRAPGLANRDPADLYLQRDLGPARRAGPALIGKRGRNPGLVIARKRSNPVSPADWIASSFHSSQ